MSGSLSTEANSEPNLTPILDMVFQLITFFMLVLNFKANAMDKDMALPIVGSAKAPSEKDGPGEEVMVININKKQQITMFNQVIDNFKQRVANEANQSRIKYSLGKDDKIPATVALRADAGTPYKIVNTVIVECQKQGFRKFSLKAMNKSDKAP